MYKFGNLSKFKIIYGRRISSKIKSDIAPFFSDNMTRFMIDIIHFDIIKKTGGPGGFKLFCFL